MAKAGKHGITQDTVKNIPFGAGTIHRNLKFADGKWNFENSIVGATSGGSKLSIKPEYQDLEIDGANVKTKGTTIKVGETAQMDINWAELSTDIIKTSLNAQEGDKVQGYTLLESKPDVVEGDYWENIAFVGRTTDGRNIIAILDNALCTNGLEMDNKSKGQGVLATTHECYADLTDDLDTLPYHIYYPDAA